VYVNDYFGRDAEDAPPDARAEKPGGGRAVLRTLEDAGARVSRLRAGDRIDLDERTRVEVLWPPGGLEGKWTANDTSLVLRVTCDGQRVLLTGDIDVAAEAALLAGRQDLRADVLVLPHHGSWKATLPAFFAAVAPRVVLVSNRRDPQVPVSADEELREFAGRLKIPDHYYSTSQKGWIGVSFGREGISVRTMRE
jgi:beta-lactamase superfamily II metal-dependent hydrolase